MLKKLKVKEAHDHFEYQSDIDRIVKIFADRGYEISHSDAVKAWEQHSDRKAVGWMMLGEDDEAFHDCFHYFEEVE